MKFQELVFDKDMTLHELTVKLQKITQFWCCDCEKIYPHYAGFRITGGSKTPVIGVLCRNCFRNSIPKNQKKLN